ncbi:uncharacterized protein KY384_000533 [Bacidia gigantensis]|uniref:uncharacterized protein n=1 Tax=Bacidia gigantensis TaxID=2732470 RepID=UPI001D04C594|nr:uncharacterized protein KY384_000533 [Bacidia gigantensis]KAG8525773.1 hypothetical protein KY384_000533 [Bacidia gigantensis]
MSYNHGSQYLERQYGQYNQNPPRPPYQQGHSSTLQSGQNTVIRRTPSFDPGDDSARLEPGSSPGQYSGSYETRGSADYQNNELHLNPQSPSYPLRSTSYGNQLPYRQQQPAIASHTQPPSTYTSYTPPAPPAPPFSPGRDAFPPQTPSSVSSQQQVASTSPTEYRGGSLGPSSRPQSQMLSSDGFHPPRELPMPSPSIHRRPVGNNGPLPPTPETPGPTPPAHSPQRNNTLGRHPHSRPLPQAPSANDGYFGHAAAESNEDYDQQQGYEDLMQEVEAAVMGRAPPSRARRSESDSRALPHPVRQDTRSSQVSSQHSTPYEQVNGNVDQADDDRNFNYDAYSDDSDAEAEAGLAAMRSADEQDAADAARRESHEHSRRSQGSQRLVGLNRGSPGNSDNGISVDMSTYGGDFPGGFHYGDNVASNEQASPSTNRNDAFAEDRLSRRSDTSAFTLPVGTETYDFPLYQQPFVPARVDTSGTGGLSEPSAHPRRHSFEDGDEATLVDTESSYPSGTPSPSKEEIPDMFFHPSSRGGRPLPAAPVDHSVPQLMPAGTYKDPEKLLQYDELGHLRYPMAPDAYSQTLTPGGTPVPRSSSLISRGSQPQAAQPIRSKTDADRQRILSQQSQQSGYRSASIYTPDSFADPNAYASTELDLPSIPVGKRRRFNPAKLSSNDFKKCLEPWALSSVVAWLKEMTEGEADLKETAVVDGIVALFTHKVPTMNTADAEVLGAKVVCAMFDSGTLLKDEEWVKFGTEEMSGVFYQLTGTGCYSTRVHTEPLPGRCYSHHCMRTLKKINLQTQVLEPQRKQEDWFTFYKLQKEDLERADKKDVERQNNLHEIVTTEDNFIDQLNVLRVLYRDELVRWQPPIIAPQRKDKFMKDVFSNVDTIKQVNEDHLLAQLKYRQQEEGPWITGFSDVFREWIRKAKTAYVDYAANYPSAVYLMKQEQTRNLLFNQFLQQMQDNERSKRLGWDTYLKAPITRLQRYGLLLSTVHKHMIKESEEKRNLAIAIEEIKIVTFECDTKVEEMSKIVDLAILQTKLKLRPGMDQTLLNLTHLGREIIYDGDLQRLGSTKLSWVDAHAILFDHYFVLAKIVEDKHPTGGEKGVRFDVSKEPIPMDLLVLENTNDDPVNKSKMGTVTAVAPRGGISNDTRAGRQSAPNGTAGPGTLGHVDSSSSVASNASVKTMVPSTNLDVGKTENLMWPFKVRHLGRNEGFTLYAATKANRQEWAKKILEAKTRHAASLYKQNAEPFRLRVIADTAFAYDGMTASGRGTAIKGTPLDRAIREVEKDFEGSQRPNPVCRATVNCATAFAHPNGTKMLAIGSDYGVYMTDYHNSRGWSRIIAAQRVTQIAVLEEFSLMLILAEKTLVAHHLDTVLSPNHLANNSNTSSHQHAPQKLSGARDIGFFAHGRMKDRQLIFYKKREGVTSVFKVLEPVYQRTASIGSASSTSSMRSRLMGGMRSLAKAGTTESFRDFDEFYIGSDTYAINLFHSSLAIATARGGIEVMTLDKKTPISVPDLKAPGVASIAARIRDMKPLGMFRLSESEFLLAYEEVGVYVNKHGDVSRGVIMEYVGRAKQACLVGAMYLILVDYYSLYIEVRNAINGRLRQVISGKDVRLLDDGGPPNQNNRASGAPGTPTMGAFGSPETVKICMQHPEWERSQIVLEMIVNEGLKE